MSLLLLIDGYNVIAPVAPAGRFPDPIWLQRERNRLIRRLVTQLSDEVRARTCVVFDAANPPLDRKSEFEVEGISVRFAVDHPEADDLLEQIIAAHSAPKNLTVVSSDHRVQAAAKRRGCTWFDSQPWLDDLIDGKVALTTVSNTRAGQGGDSETEKPQQTINDLDVEQWMRDFGF